MAQVRNINEWSGSGMVSWIGEDHGEPESTYSVYKKCDCSASAENAGLECQVSHALRQFGNQ